MKIIKENYNDYHILTIVGRGDGFEGLKDLILYCKHVGNGGHSFAIEADRGYDSNITVGWDGDGVDFIKSVKFDNEEIK